MKKYKAIIFDLDGTLIDSREDVVLATNATLKEFGEKELTHQRIASFVGTGIEDLIKKALPHWDNQKVQEALVFLGRYYFEHCLDHSCLFPDAENLLKTLRQKEILMAVFTNKPQIFTDKIISGLKVEKYFSQVFGAENGYPIKPDPAGTQALLKLLKVSARETLMVGDSGVDLATAENVGMDCALFTGGFLTAEEMAPLKKKARFVFDDYKSFKRCF